MNRFKDTDIHISGYEYLLKMTPELRDKWYELARNNDELLGTCFRSLYGFVNEIKLKHGISDELRPNYMEILKAKIQEDANKKHDECCGEVMMRDMTSEELQEMVYRNTHYSNEETNTFIQRAETKALQNESFLLTLNESEVIEKEIRTKFNTILKNLVLNLKVDLITNT